ncbi:MAG: orotate phosphoribosyltransferase [Actinomycetota bacterium]
MNEAEIRALLEEHGALQTGHFKLSSGRHSDVFVQTALILQHPGIAERCGHSLGERFAPTAPSLVLGPAMGGVIIGHEIARYLGVPMVYSERVDGEMVLRRGFRISSDERVLIAENTVTTGGSQREAIDLAREHGGDVVGVAAICDRSGGVTFGVRFEALLHVEASSWEADACPLCRDGSVPEAPGSRHLAR